MKEIAILKGENIKNIYSYGEDIIVRSITEWATISDEEFSILRDYLTTSAECIVIEKVHLQDAMDIVHSAIRAANARKLKAEQDAKVREQKKVEAAIKKKAKTLEEKQKLLTQLKKELEGADGNEI